MLGPPLAHPTAALYRRKHAPPKQEVWGNRMLSGFTLNNSAVPPMVGPNYPQPTASLDSQFRMYKQNPIHGENVGRGPSRVIANSQKVGFGLPGHLEMGSPQLQDVGRSLQWVT